MRLLYIRIEDECSDMPKNILHKDLNFSNKYIISYSKENLNIANLKNYDFLEFRNISYITAIIGKNGSGKSKLLSLIELLTLEINVNENLKFIIVYEHEKNIVVVKNNINVNCNIDNIKLIEYKKFKNNSLSIIYASNSFTWDDYFPDRNEKHNFYNASFDNFMREEKKFNIQHSGYNEKYVDNRFNRGYIQERENFQKIKNISFLSKSNISKIETIALTIDYQNVISLEAIKKLRYYSKQISNKGFFETEIYKIMNNILKLETNKTEKSKICFYFRAVDMLFDEVFGKIYFEQIKKGFCKHLDKRILKKYKKDFKSLNIMIDKLLDYIANFKYYNIYNKSIKRIYKSIYNSEEESELFSSFYKDTLIEDFKKISSKYHKLFLYIDKLHEKGTCKFYKSSLEIKGFDFGNEKTYLYIKKDNYRFLVEIFNFYNSNFKHNFFEILYGGGSAGIYAKMDLYSNIDYEINKIKTKNVLLLLDEPDLYFHPEWKRTFLWDLTNFLSEYQFKDFQIIMTTNEPYVLSDLTQNNILALDNNSIPVSKTFAANIYDLLHTQYFLEDFIGNIAIKKINNIIQEIKSNNHQMSKNKLKMQINEIGDELIKIELKKILEDYYDKDK